MATTTVPASNVAGNNQTTPVANPVMKTPAGTASGVVPGAANPVAGTAPVQANPFMPVTPTSVLPGGGGPTASVPTAGGVINNPANTFGTSGALDKQLGDIYGKGVGGALGGLLQSIGGTNSATLQEFIKSLAPQEATAQANVDASLGASGVSPNSSVNALADANLQAQEFATISGESANLTQSGQNLEASMLGGMQNTAAQQVAQSGWNIFGQVLNAGANVASAAGTVLTGMNGKP